MGRQHVSLELMLNGLKPVKLRFSKTDLQDLRDLLCERPSVLGSAVIDCLFHHNLPPIYPPARGRHAHRAVTGRWLRWMAGATYAVIEHLIATGAEDTLEAIRQHAQGSPSADSMKTRRGRWNRRELTAYVVEHGLEYDRAVPGRRPPTDDPEQFYREYVLGEPVKSARKILARWPWSYPQVRAAIGRVTSFKKGVSKAQIRTP
jgi:hypothetical protein